MNVITCEEIVKFKKRWNSAIQTLCSHVPEKGGHVGSILFNAEMETLIYGGITHSLEVDVVT